MIRRDRKGSTPGRSGSIGGVKPDRNERDRTKPRDAILDAFGPSGEKCREEEGNGPRSGEGPVEEGPGTTSVRGRVAIESNGEGRGCWETSVGWKKEADGRRSQRMRRTMAG